jgi:hypothetical protein
MATLVDTTKPQPEPMTSNARLPLHCAVDFTVQAVGMCVAMHGSGAATA